MKIAVLSTKADLSGIVPEKFETAPALLFIETEDGSIVAAYKEKKPRDYVDTIVESWCEAVVCGERIGKECFDPIADASITRYNGAGLDVLRAAVMAERGLLPIIPEYEGGPGCGGGGGECGDEHCHG